MAKAVIPLALSKYNPDKLKFPALVSVKLDGVPIKLEVTVDKNGTPTNTTLRTRADEVSYSTQTVINEWYELNKSFFEGFCGVHKVVGEITQLSNKYADFKDTSGIVRRQEDQGKQLKWNIFDYSWDGGDQSYGDRYGYILDKTHPTDNAEVIAHWVVKSLEQLDKLFEKFSEKYPKAEGLIVRNYDDLFLPNKRNNGYQKLLNEPMIDLFIIGFEEAVEASTGLGKGMVGRLIASYKGGETGVGPGKLTHAERTELWEEWVQWQSALASGYKTTEFKRMAQIKHKKDDSYDALRQPTFQYWRDEKDTPDA